MFHAIRVRLLAGSALVGLSVLAVGAPAAAATPSWHRHHAVHRVAPGSTSVSIGTAVAYVHGPDGSPVAVPPTSLQ